MIWSLQKFIWLLVEYQGCTKQNSRHLHTLMHEQQALTCAFDSLFGNNYLTVHNLGVVKKKKFSSGLWFLHLCICTDKHSGQNVKRPSVHTSLLRLETSNQKFKNGPPLIWLWETKFGILVGMGRRPHRVGPEAHWSPYLDLEWRAWSSCTF